MPKIGTRSKNSGQTTRRRSRKPLTLPSLGDMRQTASHWRWLDSDMKSSDKVYGFVYRITRDSDGKDYLGQKSFVTAKRDWPYYCSSSKTLAAEIKEHGANYIDHFTFEILFCCGDRNSLQLAETALILNEDCIHNENNYNRSIPGQRFLGPTEHTPATIEKMRKAKSGWYDVESNRKAHGEALSKFYAENGSHMKGKTGLKHPQCTDVYLGVNVETGETVEYEGRGELEAAGFNRGSVGACIKGYKKNKYNPSGYQKCSVYKGHRWYWKSQYKEE